MDTNDLVGARAGLEPRVPGGLFGEGGNGAG